MDDNWEKSQRAWEEYQAMQNRGTVTQKSAEDLMRETSPPPGIGDINSNEPGSGARYNVGKPAYDLLPWGAIAGWWGQCREERSDRLGALTRLADYQAYQDPYSLQCLWDLLYEGLDAEQRLAELAQVLDYGRKKYAAWNWSRGMSWSAVFGCLCRHVVAIALRGEETDAESGLPHRALAGANIVFLLTYMETYPEGNDMPTTLKAKTL